MKDKHVHAKMSVVIHTEEEFDWDAGFFASNNAVTHGQELIAFCDNLLAIGAHIVFAMDYAFISSSQGQQVIEHFKPNQHRNVEFAAHLHPWVNPPLNAADEVSEHDSYPGNLPRDEEFQKLKVLTEKIEALTGYRPTTYLAGRYGIGKNTYQTLHELGYKIDLSITPFTDYGYQEGPDFSQYNNDETVIEGIRCIPHSTGYVSYLPIMTDYLNKKAGHLDTLNGNLLGKVFLRLFGVRRVRLSPEGFDAKDMRLLCDSLIRLGTEHLIFSFHSPSVKAGLTPYTRDSKMMAKFTNNTLKLLLEIKKTRSKLLNA